MKEKNETIVITISIFYSNAFLRTTTCRYEIKSLKIHQVLLMMLQSCVLSSLTRAIILKDNFKVHNRGIARNLKL